MAAAPEFETATGHVLVAVFSWQQALTATGPARHTHLETALAACDRALALDPDHLDALTLKALVLRLQAGLAPPGPAAEALTAEAARLHARALALALRQRPRLP
jgi:hypothetical protein